MNATYSIRSFDVAQFNKLVANANKKAVKLGLPEYVVTVSASYTSEYVERGTTRYETLVDVTINGSTPKFAGWKLVGVVSPLKTDSGELLPLVTTVPGEHVQTGNQARDPLWCDHCKVRRDRLESFIVAHEDGTERQVGRNCLTDFLGDVRMSPAGLASLMNTLASIGNTVAEWHKGPRKFDAESLNLVLSTSLAVIRNHGWVTTKEARLNEQKRSTKVRVSDAISALMDMPNVSDTDADSALVQVQIWFARHDTMTFKDLPKAADFVSAADYRNKLSVILDEKPEGNDYVDAVRLLNFAGTVNHKAMGIAVSIIAMVDRELGTTTDPLKALVLNAQKTSQYIGEPKKRQVFTGLTFIENFQTGAGFSVATFVDPEGNLIKTFSHQTLLPGTKVNLKATVVRHDDYKGAKQTIVNRPVVVA